MSRIEQVPTFEGKVNIDNEIAVKSALAPSAIVADFFIKKLIEPYENGSIPLKSITIQKHSGELRFECPSSLWNNDIQSQFFPLYADCLKIHEEPGSVFLLMGKSEDGKVSGHTMQNPPVITMTIDYASCCLPLDQHGQPSDFFAAILMNDADRVQELLKQGADPNTVNIQNYSAMTIASQKGYVALQTLLSNALNFYAAQVGLDHFVAELIKTANFLTGVTECTRSLRDRSWQPVVLSKSTVISVCDTLCDAYLDDFKDIDAIKNDIVNCIEQLLLEKCVVSTHQEDLHYYFKNVQSFEGAVDFVKIKELFSNILSAQGSSIEHFCGSQKELENLLRDDILSPMVQALQLFHELMRADFESSTASFFKAVDAYTHPTTFSEHVLAQIKLLREVWESSKNYNIYLKAEFCIEFVEFIYIFQNYAEVSSILSPEAFHKIRRDLNPLQNLTFSSLEPTAPPLPFELVPMNEDTSLIDDQSHEVLQVEVDSIESTAFSTHTSLDEEAPSNESVCYRTLNQETALMVLITDLKAAIEQYRLKKTEEIQAGSVTSKIKNTLFDKSEDKSKAIHALIQFLDTGTSMGKNNINMLQNGELWKSIKNVLEQHGIKTSILALEKHVESLRNIDCSPTVQVSHVSRK